MQFSRYGSLQAVLYDVGESRHQQLQFYFDLYEPALGPVLEPMCGTGFFLLHFLQEGVDIDGVDGSAGMLDRCRRKCSAAGFSPALYQQRLEDMELPRQYGYIFLPEGSFSHLYEKEAAAQGLQRLYRHLLPGGKLVVCHHPPMDERWETKKWEGGWHECDDGSVILHQVISRYEDDDQVFKCVSRYELFREGALLDTQMSMYAVRFYHNDEFEQMLAAAGFVDIEAVKLEEGAKADYGATFACRRPA